MKMIGWFLLLLWISPMYANIAATGNKEDIVVKGRFAKNQKCIRCHLEIYKEFKHSKHRLSNISNNPAHKAMWEGNPLSKENRYVCAKCHAPAADNIEQLMKKGGDINISDPSLEEGISCAMCHRINDIEKTHKGNHYVLSPQKRLYRGLRKNMQESEYHDLQIGNRHFKSADVCLTCHAHHKKQKQLIVDTGVKNTQARYCVFSGVSEETTQKAQNTDKENCISCHMPQVEGSHSDRVYAPTHASHRFAAISTKIEKPERFIDIDLKQAANAFTVTLKSNIPHDLVLHPTRLFVLKVFVNEKPVKEKEFKKPWKNGSYEPLVWLKENIVYKENLNAKSKLAIEVPHKIKKGDEVRVELGYYVFNPKLAKKIGLEDEKSTRYRVFVQKKFNIP